MRLCDPHLNIVIYVKVNFGNETVLLLNKWNRVNYKIIKTNLKISFLKERFLIFFHLISQTWLKTYITITHINIKINMIII